ncbi:MAG: hypothetical protein AAFY83_13025 [Pseudomonadota bacterium]
MQDPQPPLEPLTTQSQALYLRRADAYHTALFVIGVLLVVQVTAFANLVGASSGDTGGLVCATQTTAARVAVFISLMIFLAAYHVAIVWTARMEGRWRDLAGASDAGLTARLARAVMAVNLVTTAIAAALYGAGLAVRAC